MENNHDRTLEDFREQLDLISKAGFKPIAVSVLLLEDTFVFETDEEAQKAYEKLEVEDNTVQGWWYGREEYEKWSKEYEKKYECKVLTLYL